MKIILDKMSAMIVGFTFMGLVRFSIMNKNAQNIYQVIQMSNLLNKFQIHLTNPNFLTQKQHIKKLPRYKKSITEVEEQYSSEFMLNFITRRKKINSKEDSRLNSTSENFSKNQENKRKIFSQFRDYDENENQKFTKGLRMSMNNFGTDRNHHTSTDFFRHFINKKSMSFKKYQPPINSNTTNRPHSSLHPKMHPKTIKNAKTKLKIEDNNVKNCLKVSKMSENSKKANNNPLKNIAIAKSLGKDPQQMSFERMNIVKLWKIKKYTYKSNRKEKKDPQISYREYQYSFEETLQQKILQIQDPEQEQFQCLTKINQNS